MKERRKIQRIEMRAPARMEVVAKGGKKISLQAETKDISSHGAFFITEDLLEENAKLDIEIILSMEKLQKILAEYQQIRIRIQGTVIRNDPDGIAVSFGRKYQISTIDHGRDW
jgi:hypothetical protein